MAGEYTITEDDLYKEPEKVEAKKKDVPEDSSDAPVEVRDEAPQVVDNEPEHDEGPATNEQESMARSQGWVPLEEWEEQGKDPSEWVDAREFNYRGQLMDRIKTQTRQLKQQEKSIQELKDGLRALSEHNKKIAKVEFEKAKRALKQQKITALENHDYETVADLDDKIADLSRYDVDELEAPGEEKKPEQPEGPQLDPRAKQTIDAWYADPRNEWFHKDEDMRDVAMIAAAKYRQMEGDAATPEGMLEAIERKVRTVFPQKFQKGKIGAPTVAEPSAVTGGRRPAGSSKKKTYSAKDLNDEQRRIARVLAHDGVLTEDEYAQQLADLGELDSQR